MFDSLTQKLSTTLKKLTGGGALTEPQVQEALKEVRHHLLDADVHFHVAKEICDKVKAQAIGQKVWQNISPGNQVVQIFHQELIEALGGTKTQPPTFAGKPPVVVLVCGLQGSGKTTFCGKLAFHLKKKLKKTVGVLPADCARPAAKEQLIMLAHRVGVEAFDASLEKGAPQVCREGFSWATSQFLDVLLVDTAGRQQIDNALMEELSQIEKILHPQEKFLVIDSMIGSQGLEVAKTFHEKLNLSGLVLSKLDGDARGGVALSAVQITGVPIVFAGIGEKVEDLELFYPQRMAGRILGMGDVLTLVEKAQDVVSEEQAQKFSKKVVKGDFSLEDFLEQLKMIQNMGPLEGLMKMIPGMGQVMSQLNGIDPQKEFKRIEAMIHSMTKEERNHHEILNGSRKLRISKGSGTTVADINRFLKQFMDMQKMMKQFGKFGAGGKALMKMMQGRGMPQGPRFG